MNKFYLRFLLLLMTMGAAIGMFFCPPAGATPAQDVMHDASLFCTWVHNNPTPSGVVDAVKQFVTQGVPQQEAVDIIAFAVVNVCPEFAPLVQRTADMVAPKQAV